MKKALLIGCNYTGTPNQLGGCVNDVHNIRRFLLRSGYKDENITMMTDHEVIKPSRKNMIRQMKLLFSSGADELLLHYSGHGSQVRDTNGDEKTGFDQCLVPMDYMYAGMLVDDDILKMLAEIPSKSRLFCLFDCCHSGTACDLEYNIKGKEMIGDKIGAKNQLPSRVVMMSGCQDSGTSADAWIDHQSQGAMTACFLRSTTSKTYLELFESVTRYLKDGGYEQRPNLSASYKLDLSKPYAL
jgi:hypothetical protein